MISIAMATYNGERFIQEQLDSILTQSVQDFELIVCDDCSEDNTLSVLQKYAAADSRIHVYKNEVNLGFKKNFEKAISLCSGEFIALSDQDDIWEKNHLEILLINISEKDGSVGNAKLIDVQGNDIGQLLSTASTADAYLIDTCDVDRLYRILFHGDPFQGASSLFRTELIRKALPIPDEVNYHDAWFAACACCNKGLHYTFEPITRYRMHGNNVSGNHKFSIFSVAIIKLKAKEFKTDRLTYCRELLNYFPNMNSVFKNILLEGINFYMARKNKKKLTVIRFLIKHYKQIYSVDNYKLLIPRCLGIILKG